MKKPRAKRKKSRRKACALCAPALKHIRPHPVAVQIREFGKALRAVDPEGSHAPREFFGDKDGYWEFQECVDFGLNPYDFDPMELFNLRLEAQVNAIRRR